jgi:hypothetical protein
VPVVASLPLWIPAVAIGWAVFFGGELESSPSRLLPLSGLFVLAIAASMWSLVLLVVTLATVQGLSVWRSIGTLAVSTALLLLALVALWWAAILVGAMALLPKFRWSF